MTTTATSPRRGSSCSASSSAASTLRRRDDRLASGSETTARLSAAIQDLCRLRSEWRQTTTIKTFWAYLRDEATDDIKQLVSKHADREDPMFRKHPETFLVSEADRLSYEQLSKQLSAKKKSKRSTALNDDDNEERPMKRNKRSSDDLEAKKIQRQTAETRPVGNDQQRALCSLISLYRDTLLYMSKDERLLLLQPSRERMRTTDSRYLSSRPEVLYSFTDTNRRRCLRGPISFDLIPDFGSPCTCFLPLDD
eukprot:CAMPEP_0194049466 /NCGR_PEP_ID=MMETSP0009_2-20130614/30692_1 /TAXON_ID=210454 /ORGANISM="Grammatophora oceanica, Strain CCMP 410" /LENGTH=251 /DNA_ID=CAMNT_0038695629 /DNA_START=33 /DNA_END=786 /DNA_ORIENTATION=-